jgi:hypothetical protein
VGIALDCRHWATLIDPAAREFLFVHCAREAINHLVTAVLPGLHQYYSEQRPGFLIDRSEWPLGVLQFRLGPCLKGSRLMRLS